MNLRRISNRCACLVVFLASMGLVHADLTGVAGPVSSLGVAPAIIAAPSDALNQCVTASGQLGFDEAQGVITPAAFGADDAGVIPAGTLVDSHMILLNLGVAGGATHTGVVWTFKRPIIAVMSDSGGTLEAASTPTLGAPATNYVLPATGACVPFPPVGAAPFAARGLETTGAAFPFAHTACPAGDCYTVAGATILVHMGVSQPGDWIRVVTVGAFNVAIDPKPGSDPNCFNPDGKGVVPVAILGSASFDATMIAPFSMSFGGLTVATKGNGDAQCHTEDSNGDGFTDMVCQFTDDGTFTGGPTADLTGMLTDGKLFEGSAPVCLVPAD